MRKPRIKDVAERAGVSTTTVSYVLNDVADTRVAPATRDRVRAAANDVGYRPNALAQALRTRRTNVLGFVSDDVLTSPCTSELVRGAHDAARRAGSLLLLVNVEHRSDLHGEVIHALLQRQVDGVVFATMSHQVVEDPVELSSVPHVFLDCRPRNGGSYVIPDERGGATAVVSELVAAGHRRIGHITDRETSPPSEMRMAAYRDVLKRAGIRFDPRLVAYDETDHEGGWRAACRLLDRRHPPSAVFCFTDRMAAGAYRAAAERGLRIPGDLSVVGFDDQPWVAELLWPGLTTAALPHRAMGEWAVSTLLRTLESSGPDGSGDHMVMPCALVRRASVGAPNDSHGTPRPRVAAGKESG